MSNEHEPERAALPDGAEKKAPVDPHLRDHVLPTLVMRSPVAQLVVGPDQNLVLFNDRAGTLLGLSERDIGRQFSDLDASSAIVGLGPRTVAALEGSKTVAMHEVRWLRRGTGAPTHVDVHMVPLIDGRNTGWGLSLTITDATPLRALRLEVETATRRLESARAQLRSTDEELKSTNEELKSTDQELKTTNEELRSASEELQTAHEELQSTNEELQIADEELRSTDGQLCDGAVAAARLDERIRSFLDSLGVAVVVVGPDLVVRVWSPQAEELWGLREDETIGRELLSLDSGLPAQVLRPWLDSVVDGSEAGMYGRRLTALDRRGRTVDLRVTITAVTTDTPPPGEALILFQDVSGDDLLGAGEA